MSSCVNDHSLIPVSEKKILSKSVLRTKPTLLLSKKLA